MLTNDTHLTDIHCGALVVRFSKRDDGSLTALQLLPAGLEGRTVAPRHLDGIEADVLSPSWRSHPGHLPENCVQLKLRGDHGPKAFAQGRTMRAGPACEALRFVEQTIEPLPCGGQRIRTVQQGATAGGSFLATLVLEWPQGAPYLNAYTTVENTGDTPLTLELLSSFNLDHLTPFHPGAAPEQLKLHRFRSIWSLEGRHEALLLEDLHLERSWAGYGIFCERFGQVGSMPVRGFFPFAAVEDTSAGVFWGAQLAHPGSWQMELFRRNDKVSLSGGLADREFGHWWKTLAQGASFTSPTVALSCIAGDLDDLCNALLAAQEAAAPLLPAEATLPTIFNEWCSTWGNPTHDYVLATAKVLAQTSTRYLVIDDGWAERPGNDFQQNGDWIINRKAFPDGLKATCEAVRALGMVPGIWFEFEVCNDGSKAFAETDHQLKRDGITLQIGTRRFWDFRDPWVIDYLSERVIGLLRDNGFGYLKVDYNDTLGIGCDERGDAAPGSPGEGLRQHLEAVQAFFRKIRSALPDLVIENCSSGGHRLEPSMQALCGMGSFSDAHETIEIPIISANLQRLILPRQCQIWAVIKQDDSLQRIRYSLASTFLGRMCVSGDVKNMPPEAFAELKAAQALYAEAAPVIRHGRSTVHRQLNKAWRCPKGWQAVVRHGSGSANDRLLVVLHRFADPADHIDLPLPDGNWNLHASFSPCSNASISNNRLHLSAQDAYTGHVYLLKKGSDLHK
jgi:alpha-galactosidase